MRYETRIMLMPVLAALVVMLVAGRLGAAVFSRLRQPAVLGELLAGVLLGNLGLLGFHGLDGLRGLPGLDLLAEIGVLFLLFSVGLESDLRKLFQAESRLNVPGEKEAFIRDR